MILMFLFTFGIYPIYWYCSFQNQLHKQTGMGFSGVGHFFMTFIPFYSLYWSYAVGKRLNNLGAVNNGVLYLILSIFGLGFIAWLLMQNDANNLPEKEVSAQIEA